MGIREEAFPFAGPLWVAAALLIATGHWAQSIPLLLLGGFVCFFFRDPKRHPPEDASLILSPCDGRVLNVKEMDGRLRISVFMSIFNVHVNRAPAEGTVSGIRYIPGKFLAAWAEKSSTDNEQNRITLKHDRGDLEFVQIAGLVARRIACWVSPGQAVGRGERVGLIRFGSRLDLYLPLGEARAVVSPGERVKAGASPLARWEERS